MKASILSPVSRYLLVADIERSLAFYTGQLGFTAVRNQADHLWEVIYGPARLIFHSNPGAYGDPATGNAMIFFETDNVVGLQKELKEKGLNPSGVEKVNWIKMQLFFVVDPDGHHLWFGQSYHEFYSELHSPGKKGQLRTIMPCFPCADVPEAIKYYTAVLGFSVNYQQHDLGVMDRDQVRILLVQAADGNSGTGACCIYINDADELYAALQANGANTLGEPVSRPWGLRDFSIVDQDGNRIDFAQTFE